jgi:competence protein ComEC
LDVLHPSAQTTAPLDDDNRASLVLRVTMGRFDLLLAGDIPVEAEQELLRTGLPLDAAILKVAHHGAGTSTSQAFLEAVDPRLAVISVGAENTFGHPADEVLARLSGADCRILRTDQRGCVEIITDGVDCWVRCERDPS